MPLTTLAAKGAKPKEKPYKLADERGLYLLVTPAGGRLWRLKYRFAGKEKLLALGTFPDVTLADARDAREDARRLLRNGIDPSSRRREERADARRTAANSFEAVALEWLKSQSSVRGVRGDRPRWSEKYRAEIEKRLKDDVFPAIGNLPIADVRAADVLALLKKIESRRAFEVARRVHRYISCVLRYAVVTGRAERDCAADVRGALTPTVKKHHPAITEPAGIGELIRSIDGYWGTLQVKGALQLIAHTFVRPSELLKARWPEIDFDGRLWSIPEERMKSRRAHLVPLTEQTIRMLRELEILKTSDDDLIVPGRKHGKLVDLSTLRAALRAMGFGGDTMVTHGFRSMASTQLHEAGFEIDWIEAQLAHARPGVRGVYNRALYLKERGRMMAWWSDYLDELARTHTPAGQAGERSASV